VYPKWLEPKSPVNRPSLIDQNDPKRPVNSVSLQVNLQSRIKKAENKTG
jgi:hypothetical protein